MLSAVLDLVFTPDGWEWLRVAKSSAVFSGGNWKSVDD